MNSAKTAFLAGVMFLALSITGHMALAQNPWDSIYSGNDLLRACTDKENVATALCLGYINGVRDGAVFASLSLGTKQVFEISERVEPGTLRDVVVKYLKEHPESRRILAAAVVYRALKETFPPSK